MSKLSLKSVDLKSLSGRLVRNLNWIFFAIFLFLLVLEILEIKTSVVIALGANRQPAGVPAQKGIRVNFDGYNQAVQRIQQAGAFRPTGGISKNPFAVDVPPPSQ